MQDAGHSPSARGGSAAFLTSLIFHVTLLLVLALWAFTAGKPSRGILFTAAQSDSMDTSFEITDEFSEEPEISSVDAPVIDEPDVTVDLDLNELLNQVDQQDDPVPAALTSVKVSDLAEGLKTRGTGRGASFFGAYAEGNRFVYVLDSSRSMSGDRWTYACNKLVDSIRSLSANQEFFVVCFDAQTTYIFNVRPEKAVYLQAKKGVSERVRSWLRSRSTQLGPSTMPAEALVFAMGMKPDAVFLLSDGELRDNSLLMLREMRRFTSVPMPPIHSIHLFSPQGRATLELIAQESGGTFTHVGEPGRR